MYSLQGVGRGVGLRPLQSLFALGKGYQDPDVLREVSY
jgi:hypothetical protein